MKNSIVLAVWSVLLTACDAGDSRSATEAAVVGAATQPAEIESANTAEAIAAETCLASANARNEADRLEAALACPMIVTDKVTVQFVGTDETYGCEPRVVAVAPSDSPREYVRVAIQHGTEREFTGVVRLQHKVLKDRKSAWRNYGWPGNPPLEPCSTLPMKVVGISCKVAGEPDYQPCEEDVNLLPSGLFLSEELLQ